MSSKSDQKKLGRQEIFFKSRIWEYFKVCEDRTVAECEKCGEQITRCGQNAKRPRLDNLRKHLLKAHEIDIPTAVEEIKKQNNVILKKQVKKSILPRSKNSPNKKTRLLTKKIAQIEDKDVETLNDESLTDPVMCIRWNTYYSNMTSALPNLLQSEEFVDVTLACDGQSLKCHKILLAACSPYFYNVLSSSPCSHPIIMFKDFHFWELQALVSFIYSGEVNVHHSQLARFLRVADALQIKGLAKPVSKEGLLSENENEEVAIPENLVETYKKKTEEPTKPVNVQKKCKTMSNTSSKNLLKRVNKKTKSPSTKLKNKIHKVKRRVLLSPNKKLNSFPNKRVSPRRALTKMKNVEDKKEPVVDSNLQDFLPSDMPDMLNDILAMKDMTEGISLPEAHRVGSVDGVFPLDDLEAVIGDEEPGINRLVTNGLHSFDHLDYFQHINAGCLADEEGK